nr:hypothetical protein GCM10020241_27670 [Streptoalloteichus tenebrarius]
MGPVGLVGRCGTLRCADGTPGSPGRHRREGAGPSGPTPSRLARISHDPDRSAQRLHRAAGDYELFCHSWAVQRAPK